jgi:glycosyltransferase involved in cell wall biosynthesis
MVKVMSLSSSGPIVVLIPTLNEEFAILQTINSVREHLPESQIIVIDNGSTDLTVDVATNAGAQVYREPRRGKGFAIRRGFQLLPQDCRIVIMLDGDDTYSCANITDAIDFIEHQGYDMIVGTRVPSAQIEEGRKPIYRRSHSFGNFLISLLSKALHPSGIQDSLSGYRVMSIGFVKSFPGGATGFEIEAELNAHSYLISAAVGNIEIEYRGRGELSSSKLRTYKDGYKIVRINFALFRNNRPQLAFTLFAIPWFVVGCFYSLRALLRYIETGLVLQFPSFIAGVAALTISALLFTTGMILERIKLTRVDMARFMYKS